MALILLSMCVTSCSEDYGNGLNLPQPSQKTDTTKTQPTTDSTEWTNYAGTTHKVFPQSYVVTKIFALNDKGESDSLVNRYPFVRSLKNDTTLYLSKAPETGLGYTGSTSDQVWLGEYTHNAQNDSCAVVYGRKGYKLSNGVILTLNTERMTLYHMIDGTPRKYSEPNQKFGTMTIDSVKTEFERNDSIYCLRTNTCKTYTKLGDQTFVDSCTVREVWFIKLKETPEPKYDVFVNEAVKHLASSMVEISSGNWKNVHLMTGSKQLHAIVCTTDMHNANVVAVEDKPVDLSRVVVNSQVNSSIYDATTGLFTTSLISPDNTGWSWEGFIDGRSVTNDMGNARAIDEGIKNFMETNTSKPTPFFTGVKAEVTATWKEYSYTTITWTKYSKEGKAYMNSIVVKSPKKA